MNFRTEQYNNNFHIFLLISQQIPLFSLTEGKKIHLFCQSFFNFVTKLLGGHQVCRAWQFSTRSCVCKSKYKCVHVCKSADKVCSFDPMRAASLERAKLSICLTMCAQ